MSKHFLTQFDEAAPHWRQGPEEKPVLCNACGIRFKHWGNLHNYTPKHCVPNNLNNHKLVKDNGNTSSNVPDEDSDNGKLVIIHNIFFLNELLFFIRDSYLFL